MNSLADRFRRWYEYERDCNAKSLEMLASVPAERRSAPEFQKAVDRMAHLLAARVAKTEAAWVAYLEKLDERELARTLEWEAGGKRYRWDIEGILTQVFG